MANMNSAKGNPASKRMMNQANKAKRAANKAKNESATFNGVTSQAEKKKALLSEAKKNNFNLGQREVRRILDGTNKNHNLPKDQIAQLRLINGSTEAMRINIEKNME